MKTHLIPAAMIAALATAIIGCAHPQQAHRRPEIAARLDIEASAAAPAPDHHQQPNARANIAARLTVEIR